VQVEVVQEVLLVVRINSSIRWNRWSRRSWYSKFNYTGSSVTYAGGGGGGGILPGPSGGTWWSWWRRRWRLESYHLVIGNRAGTANTGGGGRRWRS
jgi:hypothetical protein